MIELPEAVNLDKQLTDTIGGKKIAGVVAGFSPHKFTWYHRDPKDYDALMRGKTIGTATSHGGIVEIRAFREVHYGLNKQPSEAKPQRKHAKTKRRIYLVIPDSFHQVVGNINHPFHWKGHRREGRKLHGQDKGFTCAECFLKSKDDCLLSPLIKRIRV